jgi:membrane-anchored mycosin MYCP
MLPTDTSYEQAAGHATFVTGLILSQAPGATVRMRQVLRKDGGYVADVWTVANEIVALGRSGVDILNISLVCYTEDGQPPLALATAIDRLDPNIVVVAAAGNHGDVDRRDPPVPGVDEQDTRKPTFPAALDDVVAVGAADNEGKVARFTPRGTDWIDFLAPGEGVLSTYLAGTVVLDGGRRKDFTGLGRWTGTSFSTEPGRVTARQALENIRDSVLTPGGYPPGTPPFVWLDVR